MSTNVSQISSIKRNWHFVDVKNKVLGRVATDIAKKITGKGKVAYVPYLDGGDYVVVTNAKDVKITGKKEVQKRYVNHSGYPGGLRVEMLEDLRIRRPEEVVRLAVKGMIPGTKLGKQMIKRLKIYAGETHPYKKNMKKEEGAK